MRNFKTITLISDLKNSQKDNYPHISVLLVISFLVRFLVSLVGLRVHTPHALGPLPVDDTVLLFTGQRADEQEEQEEEVRGEEKDGIEDKIRQKNKK